MSGLISDELRRHLAFSIMHGTFNPDPHGGCSCAICTEIRLEITKQQREESECRYLTK